MQPHNDYDVPTGIDYLNQISAPPAPQGFDKKSKIILLVLGIIGLLGLAFIINATQNASRGPSLNNLAARLQKLQTVSEKFTSRLKSSQLQDANSSLTAVLTTANKSIETPAAAQNIDVKKDLKNITALDPPTKLEEKFEEAYLNADLDNTYAYTMNTELADTLLMMNRIKEGSRSKSTIDFLEKTISDLTNVRKQLMAITGDSEKS